MSEKQRRRGMSYGMLKKNAKGENDAKSQVSLEPGSEEYKGYLLDRMGVEEKDITSISRLVDSSNGSAVKLSDEDQAREAAQDMGKEPAHVSELAGDLAAAGEAQSEQGADVAERKYRRMMNKIGLAGEMKESLVNAASTTATKSDDKVAHNMSRRNVDDLPDIHDDTVTEEEYVPGAAGRYFR